MSHRNYEEAISVTRIGSDVERFTPDYEVVSVNLAISEDGESEVFSLQRAVGSEAEAEDDEGVCLVLSPSQQCSNEPFEALTLTRSSLGMRFTTQAQKVFNVSSIVFEFEVSDVVFQDIRETLNVVCGGAPYFTYAENAT